MWVGIIHDHTVYMCLSDTLMYSNESFKNCFLSFNFSIYKEIVIVGFRKYKIVLKQWKNKYKSKT